MSSFSTLRSSTAMDLSLRYLAYALVQKDCTLIQVIRLVVFEFRLSSRIIEVAIYQAFNPVTGRYHQVGETPDVAAANALVAGGMAT